jgi:thymidylate synthase
LNHTQKYPEEMKLKPGKLVMNFGDIHLYEEHISAAYLQILRGPGYPFCRLMINNDHDNIEDYLFEDIKVENYQKFDSIKAKMFA